VPARLAALRNSARAAITLAPRAEIFWVISNESRQVEQILIRNLPTGTKAALRARAESHHRSAEAEAREILADAVGREPATMVDLLATVDGADIDFNPDRLGLTSRTAPL